MKKFTLLTLLSLFMTSNSFAQFTEAGYYRVQCSFTKRYVSVKGTEFSTSTSADAFWGCIKMQSSEKTSTSHNGPDSAYISDPGTIIYIPQIGSSSKLYGQGINTYGITNTTFKIAKSSTEVDGMTTYIASKNLIFYTAYLQDYCGFDIAKSEANNGHWWLKPVNEASIETSYFGVAPLNENIKDSKGWYWTTLCCDFPCLIPEGGGVEGAYTIEEITTEDGENFAVPVKKYAQGETIPGATPVLIKCKYPYASGNKLIPTGNVKNNTSFPLTNGLLKGNYFGPFTNPNSTSSWIANTTYTPDEATKHDSSTMRVLNVNKEGKIGFYKMSDDVEYMSYNKCWLDISSMSNAKAVYLDFDNIVDNTTGISEVCKDRDTSREGIYDMQGRRVEKPGKGLYIVNGKKVLFK